MKNFKYLSLVILGVVVFAAPARADWRWGHRRPGPVVVVPAPVIGIDVGYRRTYYTRHHRSLDIDVQVALSRRGYYRGPIDGDIGPGSRAAIRAYQYDRHLPVSGYIDGPLVRSLGL